MPPARTAQPPPANSTESAFKALIRTFGLLRRVMDPFFARFGISGSQWGVLITLHRSELGGDEGLRLTDLGQRLLVRPPSVTGVVDRLQRMGLVTRTASMLDQRAKHVALTPSGRRLVDRILEEHTQRVQAILSGLKPGEQTQLHQLLDRMASHLNTLAESEDIPVESDEFGKE